MEILLTKELGIEYSEAYALLETGSDKQMGFRKYLYGICNEFELIKKKVKRRN